MFHSLLREVIEGTTSPLLVVVSTTLHSVWSRHLTSFQSSPVEASKPFVTAQFMHTVCAQTVCRFPLQQLVDEVESVEAPTSDLLLDGHLAGQHVVADISLCLAEVGASTQTTLVQDDA